MQIAPLLLTIAGFLLAQDATNPTQATPSRPAGTTEAAWSIWQRLGTATRAGEESPDPIAAFVIEAEVLLRDGVRTNELSVRYQFKEPHFIRFRLPGGRETGRGPGTGRKAYWLKDGEEVIVLDGRENAEDRRQVDEMVAIAHNYVALSDPTRLELLRLELLEAPPASLPTGVARDARKLVWIRLASRDFALFEGERRSRTEREAVYVVDLGIDGATGLAKLAVILPPASEEPWRGPEPMLIRLSRYRPQEGFVLPAEILVHRPDRSSRLPLFEKMPAQEIYVMKTLLRPELDERSFAPL